jgi:anti-anti-sigma factor
MNSQFTFEVQRADRPDTFVCKVSGSVDISTSSELEQIGIKLIQNCSERLVFDFSELTYINSQGLGALLSLHKALDKKAGGVLVIGMNDRVKRVFDITGMDTAITSYPTLADALAKDPLFTQA